MLPALLRSILLGLGLAAVLSAQSPAPTPAPDLASNPAPVRGRLNPALPTLFVAGDSTAARGRGERQQGWAEPFAAFFDSAQVNVANRARGGRSSRTFVTEGLWDQVLADLKAGDVVLIQFGHNDGGALNDEPPPPLRARGSIPGLGDESKAIDNVLTKKPEVVRTFGWYLRKMIADTRARGATPVLVTLTLRNVWKDGKIERGTRYSRWTAELAAAEKVALVDLNTAMADRFDAMGPDAVAALYPQDHTHFNAEGARLHAAAVVAALRALPSRSITRWLATP